MGCARVSRGDGRGEVNGDTVEESGGRENAPRELCTHEVLPGLVPRFEGDSGVVERAICHGAGDDRRITV